MEKQKQLWRILVKLYPRAWRARYADEFLAMLDTVKVNRRRVTDVVRGAIDAHLHPELLIANGGNELNRWIMRVGALGALLSILVVAIALLPATGMAEELAEFLIVLAPLSLLPVVLALHQESRLRDLRTSRIVMTIGVVGTLALPLLFAVHALPGIGDWLSSNLPPHFSMLVIALFAVWMVLSSLLGMRTKTVPTLLVFIGAVSGASWILLLGSGVVTQPLSIGARQLLNLNIPIWLLSYSLWTIGVAVWLVRRSVNGTRTLPRS